MITIKITITSTLHIHSIGNQAYTKKYKRKKDQRVELTPRTNHQQEVLATSSLHFGISGWVPSPLSSCLIFLPTVNSQCTYLVAEFSVCVASGTEISKVFLPCKSGRDFNPLQCSTQRPHYQAKQPHMKTMIKIQTVIAQS